MKLYTDHKQRQQ